MKHEAFMTVGICMIAFVLTLCSEAGRTADF